MSKRAGEGEEQNDNKKLNPQLADPINITKWIEDNKSSFLPPVCNKMMWVVLETAHYSIMLFLGSNLNVKKFIFDFRVTLRISLICWIHVMLSQILFYLILNA